MNFETENIEFKSQFTEEVYKEVIAFANTDGGIVYIGIDNEGNAVGLTDVDTEYTRITNGIRDAIMPDVTMCVKYVIQDNKVVRISVNEGTNKPYYLKSKGIRPGGVYVRQGTSSVPASHEQIRQMIKESDGDVFEEMRSQEQELTFNETQKAFDCNRVDFGKEKYRLLGITDKNDVYTNLALLLSDQCMHTTKIAVFADENCTVFRDRREFGGSVFSQLEATLEYLDLCNKTASEIKGFQRTDKKDYPEEAVREAYLNALIHRDYSFSGSIIVNVTDERMEFISIGGLLPGLLTEDIRAGISLPRNKKLAEVFHRINFVESYGTGIRRIFNLYENFEVQPSIEVTQNTFKIILPNMNTAKPKKPVKKEKVTKQMQQVLMLIEEKGDVTEKEISNLLGLKKTRTFTVAKQMRDMGLIDVTGRGENKRYFIK